MADEEELCLEVEAMQAVYGDDCRVIQEFPPHLAVHIRPRTAGDSSQQFVEVILGIKSSIQYPMEPPHVYVIEMKGLDENRQAHLITRIKQKACELSSNLMLVALCEAVEILSSVNHPEGNCPLCLYPLVSEDKSGSSLPFMKLMSCFHCFHSECIIRWWKWLQEQDDSNCPEEIISVTVGSQRDIHACTNQQKGNCPVCRKVFDEKDMEHVSYYLGTSSIQAEFATANNDEDEKVVLQSESENNRRQQFETLLGLQQERNGLIEPRKNLSIAPGMFLPLTSIPPATSTESTGDQSQDTSGTSNEATTSKQKTANFRRKHRTHSSRKQQQHGKTVRRQQWIQKGMDTSDL
ncbi:uncharacterized protein [Typha angustifolia]|uniref:uncharacterized protein isoform X2 n=1 Tax=Typha angustifolia TaxID=59011 RepID=UPI003C308D00